MYDGRQLRWSGIDHPTDPQVVCSKPSVVGFSHNTFLTVASCVSHVNQCSRTPQRPLLHYGVGSGPCWVSLMPVSSLRVHSCALGGGALMISDSVRGVLSLTLFGFVHIVAFVFTHDFHNCIPPHHFRWKPVELLKSVFLRNEFFLKSHIFPKTLIQCIRICTTKT